ncbi:MAG: rod shape-determining protein RodA [Nitriliruptorales bacterium]|nr:rod shape-determining protein RodA [Nitriliruptorales bacterium]
MDVGYHQDRNDRMLRQRVQDQWMDAYAPLRHLDPSLVLLALALSAIGVVMIYSAKLHALELDGLPTDLYSSRQLISLAIGVAAMVVAALFDYRYVRAYSVLIYLGAIAALVLVLTPFGVSVNGQQAWVSLGGFQFQPAEFGKVAVIIGMAAVLHERREQPGFVTVVLSLLVAAIPLGLIMLQPDLGSATVFVWIAFIMLLAAGIKARYLLVLGALGIAGIVAVVQLGLLQEHQLARLTAFIDPTEDVALEEVRYNSEQSMIAIGSGQLDGKGLFNGTQTSLSYVPENHTDFIFTVAGEELGFVGASVILGLFLLLLWRCLRIAALAKDHFGMLLAAGTVGMIVFQVFVNVGMAVGIMPVIGIPLPFISFGGTSLIATFILIGLLLNVHMRRF